MPVSQAKPQVSGCHDLASAYEAHRLAKAIEAAIARRQRNEALQAILARLDAARRDNAERYLAERLHRETSHDLS